MDFNTKVSSADATRWLETTGYDDSVDLLALRFMEQPKQVPHIVIAMLCIARSAETPQNLESVYVAVREWEHVISPTNRYRPGKPKKSILKEAVVARGEMTDDEFEDLYQNVAADLIISRDRSLDQ